MLEIEQELKNLYKQDNVHKDIILYFPELDLTITNDKIASGSMSITESICQEDDLTLGACESSQFKIIVADIIQNLSGLEFTVIQELGNYTMPLGTYVVSNFERQADRRLREITAYDNMKSTDVDVSDWYNSLKFPISVKEMRQSLLTYLGIEYEDQTLTNDEVLIEKTINPSSLVGRDVLKKLCEINAGFGHMSRNNRFKVIQLSGLGLYPSETLYPAEDLFPSESGEYVTAGYRNVDYEEYYVEPITGISIRQDTEDVGATVGTNDNIYAITGNFLLYGKSTEELERIAFNILLQVKNKYYRPHNTTMIGLPYMEVGDAVTIITSDDAIETFIFKRTLKGIHSLTDEISATGNQKRAETITPKTEIESLKGKTLRIEKSIDQLSVSMTDLEQGLSSQIALTASQLQTQITDNYNNTNSQISQLADNIELKVSKDGIISAINLSPESAKIQATNIELEGIVTANNNFKILLDGSIEAVNGKFNGTITNINSSGQEAARIYDGTFNGTSFNAYSYSSIINGISGTTFSNLRPGYLIIGAGTGTIIRTIIDLGSITTNSITCNSINGYTPITAGNKSSYTFPPESHYQDSTTINPITTAAGNVGLNKLNVASVNWCNATFQPLSSSDLRLKYDILQIDDKLDKFFDELSVKTFKFKPINDGTKESPFDDTQQHVGLIAQQVKSALVESGITEDFAIIQTRPVRDNTLEGMYVDDEILRVNYEELTALTIRQVQKLKKEIQSIKEMLLQKDTY